MTEVFKVTWRGLWQWQLIPPIAEGLLLAQVSGLWRNISK